MTWKYRLVRHKKPKTWFGLHEVYYDSFGRPASYTEKPVDLVSDQDGVPAAIGVSLRQALADAGAFPVIDEAEFGAG
jgi:hypothetical protein